MDYLHDESIIFAAIATLCMLFVCYQCGVVLGLLLMLSSAWLTDVACRLLIKTAFLSKKHSYEYLGKCLLYINN